MDTKATLISVWVSLGSPEEHRALLSTSLRCCCRAWDPPEAPPSSPLLSQGGCQVRWSSCVSFFCQHLLADVNLPGMFIVTLGIER